MEPVVLFTTVVVLPAATVPLVVTVSMVLDVISLVVILTRFLSLHQTSWPLAMSCVILNVCRSLTDKPTSANTRLMTPATPPFGPFCTSSRVFSD